ncbi:Caveolin-1 [Mactra antiquata]
MDFSTLDMINRDPNEINSHVKVGFEDVIAEPDEAHSFEVCWKFSYCCFSCWKACCYKLVTFFCACCISANLGCDFACIALQHVWCCTPCLRFCSIQCNPWQKCWGMCCNCILGPVCEACGRCFTNIKVTRS